jgi:DNA-binding IclR family transcriptional regulator
VPAVCLATPTARFTQDALAAWVPMVASTARRIEEDLSA